MRSGAVGLRCRSAAAGASPRRIRCSADRRRREPGSRCWRRSARTARGKYTGPGRCRGCASRRRVRRGNARTSGGIGAPSLATLRKARASSRDVQVAARSRPARALAWRCALSSRLTSTRRRCSASKATPSGCSGSSTRNTLWSPSLRLTERAQSLQTAATCPVASMACTSCIWPGATSMTSSTMRLSRSTLSATICINCRWPGSVASSASSALACAIAASGLRISWAMPADTRPIAASFSCRLRACMLRTSSRNSTQKSSLACAARWRVNRTRTRNVRFEARLELERHVAALLGPARLDEGLLDGAHQPGPGLDAAQLEGRRPAHAGRREQPARRRVGGAHAATPVDDEDAVVHFLDHQPVQRSLLPRHLHVAARAELFARQAPGEFAGQHGDDEEAAARQRRLRHQLSHGPPAHSGQPGGYQQHQRHRRRGGQGQRARRGRTPAISTGSTSSAT